MQECEGSSASRLSLDALGKYATSNGHRLWRTGPYVWCIDCGCYTTRRICGLGQRCGARPVQGRRRTNLMNGKHPAALKRDAAIAVPIRLTVAKWLEWTFSAQGVERSLEDLEPSTVAELMIEGQIQAEA
eukprot:10392961-Karenia_brevis.AAC.1